MTDITEDMGFWEEYYGLRFDEDGEELPPNPAWRPDFTKWVACFDPSKQYVIVAPKPYWDQHHVGPNWPLTFHIPGMDESEIHAVPLNRGATPEEAQAHFEALGFEFIQHQWEKK